MGYYYTQRECKFFVPEKDAAKVKGILEKMATDLRGHWDLTGSENGDIVSCYHGESKSFDEEFLRAIATYVREGSYVEIAGEDDDDIFRLIFKGGEVIKVMAEITFPE